MMTGFSPDEIATLGTCIDAIGTAEFPRLIGDFCAGLCSADSVFLTAFFDGLTPAVLYGNHSNPSQQALLSLYLEAAYLLDPFYLHFGKKLGDQVLSLHDVAPDDFAHSEYFAKFFSEMGLTNECGLLLHMSDSAGVFMSLGYSRQGARTDTVRLAALKPVLSALARRHWATLTPQNTDGTGRLSAQLNAALAEFGSSVLSPREREISLMILRGHSSKAIANTLGNSPETVKVHRKRIYTKLGVSGQGELLSLFLESLRRMPAGAQGDPITYMIPSPTP